MYTEILIYAKGSKVGHGGTHCTCSTQRYRQKKSLRPLSLQRGFWTSQDIMRTLSQNNEKNQ